MSLRIQLERREPEEDDGTGIFGFAAIALKNAHKNRLEKLQSLHCPDIKSKPLTSSYKGVWWADSKIEGTINPEGDLSAEAFLIIDGISSSVMGLINWAGRRGTTGKPAAARLAHALFGLPSDGLFLGDILGEPVQGAIVMADEVLFTVSVNWDDGLHPKIYSVRGRTIPSMFGVDTHLAPSGSS